MKSRFLYRRRELLIAAPMLTASLLLPKSAITQSSGAADKLEFEPALEEIGHAFSPTVSVGNVCGRAVKIPTFVELAKAAPTDLLGTFEAALQALSSRAMNAASSDYFDYRLDTAGRQTDRATSAIASDVAVDQAIILILIRAIEHDLAVADQLIRDDSLSVSQFRVQMLVLREQLHLLNAENRRAKGGGGIYLPIEERSRRSLKAENIRLENEVASLRARLEQSEQRSAELATIILRRN